MHTIEKSQSAVQSLTEPKSITLTVRGVGEIPSFKNKKRAIVSRTTGKLMIVTETKVKKRFNAITNSLFTSLCESVTTQGVMQTERVQPFLTACVPQDDNWHFIPIITIT